LTRTHRNMNTRITWCETLRRCANEGYI
jgi:hypothetical protein